MGIKSSTTILTIVFILSFLIPIVEAGNTNGNLDLLPPPSPPPPSHFIAVEKKGKGLFRLGSIQINRKTKNITFPATINMDKGLLEYLLVKSTGKTHESLLRTKIDPYYLNIAFLLLGFEGTDHPLTQQGANEKPQGNPVKIELIYKHEGDSVHVTPNEWVVKKKNEMVTVPAINWLYTGSVVFNGQLLAQTDGSIVALFHDPAALIDNTDPEGSNDEIWFVNEKTVPPIGTDVTVSISPVQK